MVRPRAIQILFEELQRSDGLPPNADKHFADMLADRNIGPGLEAAIRAVIRAAAEKAK